MIENGNFLLLFISFLLKPGINVDFYISFYINPLNPPRASRLRRTKTHILQYTTSTTNNSGNSLTCFDCGVNLKSTRGVMFNILLLLCIN